MGAVADFRLLNKSCINELKSNATIQKKLFKKIDTYYKYMDNNSIKLEDFKWSGYIFATLLIYLEEKEINLMDSELKVLADFLCDKRNSSHFIFTFEHKKYLKDLKNTHFDETQMNSYYNDFNQTDELSIGSKMLDGIKLLGKNLERLNEDSFIVLSIY